MAVSVVENAIFQTSAVGRIPVVHDTRNPVGRANARHR